jgi:hypothetical protein
MRVLVCGGRNFSSTKLLFDTLDRLHKEHRFTVVIEGNAKGADRLAGYWARHKGIENKKYPANWRKEGVSAGPKRNQQMLSEGKPELVIAFPGGPGTKDMVYRAKRAGIQVMEIYPNIQGLENGTESKSPSQKLAARSV